MSKQVNQKMADDLSEIMSNQIDILTGEDVSAEDIHIADAVANMIGKTLKLAGLRMAYEDHKKNGGAIIQTLETRK